MDWGLFIVYSFLLIVAVGGVIYAKMEDKRQMNK